MGLLVIHDSLLQDDSELIFTVFDWLKKQCNAFYTEITSRQDRLNNHHKFLVEGDGIPMGFKEFDIEIKRLTPDVFTIQIKEYGRIR